MRTAIVSQPMKDASPAEAARVRQRAEDELAALGYRPYGSVYDAGFDHAEAAKEES